MELSSCSLHPARMRPAHTAVAVLVAAIWGLNFVVIEVGLDDFPPLLLSALRYTLAALPLLALRGMPPVAWRWVIAVGVAIG
jgi:O-acetylserine/cysteine efflux transporter